MRLGDYYPDIRWIEAGTVAGGSLLARSGYFVLAECGRIECCRPTGPFATKEEARVVAEEFVARSRANVTNRLWKIVTLEYWVS